MNNSELLTMMMDKLSISTEDFAACLVHGGVTDAEVATTALVRCEKSVVEAFLNGYIILKRGVKETKPGDGTKAPLPLKSGKSVNNVILKKLKIAYSLTNEDLVDVFESVDRIMSKNDLTTYFRKEGHKHYRLLMDRDLIAFLDGVALID